MLSAGNRWRAFSAVLVLAGISIFPAHGAKKPAAAKVKINTARTSYNFFSIEFPKGWSVKQKDQGGTVIASHYTGPYLMVWSEELGRNMSAEQYFQERWADVQRDPEFLVESETGKTIIDGKEARWAVFSQMISGKKHRIVQYWLTDGARGHNVSGSAEPGKFSEYKSQFESAAQSFKIAGSSRR